MGWRRPAIHEPLKVLFDRHRRNRFGLKHKRGGMCFAVVNRLSTSDRKPTDWFAGSNELYAGAQYLFDRSLTERVVQSISEK